MTSQTRRNICVATAVIVAFAAAVTVRVIFDETFAPRHCHVNRKLAGQMSMAATVHAATVAWRHVSIA